MQQRAAIRALQEVQQQTREGGEQAGTLMYVMFWRACRYGMHPDRNRIPTRVEYLLYLTICTELGCDVARARPNPNVLLRGRADQRRGRPQPSGPPLGRSGTLGNDGNRGRRDWSVSLGGFCQPAERPSRGLAMVRNVDALQQRLAYRWLGFCVPRVLTRLEPAPGSLLLFATHASFCVHHGARPPVILGCSVSRQDLK